MRIVHIILLLAFVISAPTILAAKKAKESAQKKSPTSFEEAVYSWMGTFAEVLQKTEEKHYHIADPQECMIHAINGFLACLDPHSGFLDPKTYTSVLESTSGQFFGIGIVMDNTRQAKDNFLLVVDVVPDGPAQKAGLQRLDKIIEIEGKSLDGMTTEEATSLLRGDRNTTVHVKVLRENQTDLLTFAIVRDIIKEQNSLAFFLPQHNICYIHLTMFTDNSIKQMEQLIQQAQAKQYKALIIDLRNNSGGLLNAVVDIAGLFLDKGSVVVSTKDRDGKETYKYTTMREPVAKTTLPIFILTNNYTASAAEILAGSLKIHAQKSKKNKKPMIFIVGTRTFGKGSVQEVIPVSNNSAIKITIALYFLPFDTAIQGEGIEPDFIVEQQLPRTEQMKWFSKFYGRESALRNYINPKGKSEKTAEEASDDASKNSKEDDKTKTWLERTKDILKNDNQLKETVTLINLFDLVCKNMPEKVKNCDAAVDFLKTIYTSGNELELEEIK